MIFRKKPSNKIEIKDDKEISVENLQNQNTDDQINMEKKENQEQKTIVKKYKPIQTKTRRQKRLKKMPRKISKACMHTSEVIIKPHITEKSSLLSESDVYTFVVKKKASSKDVKNAVKEIYGADLSKVSFAKKGPKKISIRRQGNKNPGQKKSLKKAYVKLKKGSKIKLS